MSQDKKVPFIKLQGKSTDKPNNYCEEYEIIDAEGKTKKVKRPVTFLSRYDDMDIHREIYDSEGSLKKMVLYSFRNGIFLAQTKDDIDFLENHPAHGDAYFKDRYPDSVVNDMHAKETLISRNLNIMDADNVVVKDYIEITE